MDTVNDSSSGLVYKVLNLITPEKANELGLHAAEAPVFVSPDLTGPVECKCGVEFKPLVYQTGYTVESHHFHDYDNSGGIYHYSHKKMIYSRKGWYAVMEQIGKKSIWEKRDGHGHSEAVKVLGIYAYCTFPQSDDHGSDGEQLNQGLTVASPIENMFEECLIPVCLDVSDITDALYEFMIVDGNVGFIKK